MSCPFSIHKSRLIKAWQGWEGSFQRLITQKAICWYLRPLWSGFRTSRRDDKARRRVCVKSNQAKHWNHNQHSPNMTSVVLCVLASPSLTTTGGGCIFHVKYLTDVWCVLDFIPKLREWGVKFRESVSKQVCITCFETDSPLQYKTLSFSHCVK